MNGAHFVSVQNEFSLFHREPEKDMLIDCEHAGIAFLPYFPLASGLLTGKYRKGQKPPEGAERVKDSVRKSSRAKISRSWKVDRFRAVA